MPSMWCPTPSRFTRLMFGLTVFGAGEGCIVAADLGNSPWTVLAQGVSLNTPMSIGLATIVISFAVLAIWIPLRQRPGLGTIANAIWVGIALGLVVDVVPGDLALGVRWALMLGGITMVAIGSGFYLTAALGPGPRDGLMTGFNRRTGASLRLVRSIVEITVLVAGIVLGGTAGIGTVLFALGIGPGVQYFVGVLETPEWRATQAPAWQTDSTLEPSGSRTNAP